ncbi:antitoxin [Georgenia subflava]|uniref:Antitoxin n=1 Tax=Georgenia subflava TaxID=1622177 RepID=A0A6N7EHA9_9MICO|nr:antitoxin [Georgenia subflava]MPV36368.1 antitoxin [Georgenia subflava]
MRTLYLRNVPDEVLARLESLAKREQMSVSAFAVRELSAASRRADNARLLAELPVLELSTTDVLAAIDEGRAGR